MSSHPLLTIESIHAYYDSSHVLQGTTLSLESGVVGVIGRNGMGKSTLVKAIMGIVPVKSGRVLLQGEEITNLKPYQIAARGVGYVPQGRGIFPSLSVEEHLKLAAKPKAGDSWTIERVYQMFPKLKDLAKSPGNSLSGGQQQMLAIGRALVTNPSLLVMDEPSEGLAPVTLDEIIATFHSLIETGISLLIVEQNLHTITSLIENEIYVMVAGRIAQKVSRDLLLHDDKAREQLLGVAQQEVHES